MCSPTPDSFTSHYVTINSKVDADYVNSRFTFTSHYVTINSGIGTEIVVTTYNFTSHYVTINSLYGHAMQTTGKTLHPTM